MIENSYYFKKNPFECQLLQRKNSIGCIGLRNIYILLAIAIAGPGSDKVLGPECCPSIYTYRKLEGP